LPRHRIASLGHLNAELVVVREILEELKSWDFNDWGDPSLVWINERVRDAPQICVWSKVAVMIRGVNGRLTARPIAHDKP
jgi:hypothetical protein